jgi:hypothetical protein
MQDLHFIAGIMVGTCDWGYCDRLAISYRYACTEYGEPIGWLPVCEDHAVEYILAA